MYENLLNNPDENLSMVLSEFDVPVLKEFKNCFEKIESWDGI